MLREGVSLCERHSGVCLKQRSSRGTQTRSLDFIWPLAGNARPQAHPGPETQGVGPAESQPASG